MIAKRSLLLLGKCMKANKGEGVEVSVVARELDTYLNIFFPEKYTFFAYDSKDECKPGDIILIKKREEPLTRKITHDVSKIVYPFGNITDPITGKKVVGGSYKEDLEDLDRSLNPTEFGFTKFLDRKRAFEKLPPAPPKPAPRFVRRGQRDTNTKD